MIVTPTLSGGGAEKIAVNLSNYYASRGIPTSLVVLSRLGPYEKLVSKDVEIVFLDTKLKLVFFKLAALLKSKKPSHILSVINGANI